MRTYRKDITEKIRLGFDWSDLLNGDTIASAEWAVPSGIDADNASAGEDWADIDVYGGTAGQQYRLSNTVTTADGLIYERSFMVIVVDR